MYINVCMYIWASTFISQDHMALYSRYGNVRLRETLWARIQDYVDMMWAAF